MPLAREACCRQLPEFLSSFRLAVASSLREFLRNPLRDVSVSRQFLSGTPCRNSERDRAFQRKSLSATTEKNTFRKYPKHVVLALVSADMYKKPTTRDTSSAMDHPPSPGKRPENPVGRLGRVPVGSQGQNRFQNGPPRGPGGVPGISQAPPRSDLDEKTRNCDLRVPLCSDIQKL